MENEKLEKIKCEKSFKKLTKKNKKYSTFLKGRVSSHIDENLAKNMVEFSLNKKSFLIMLKKIEKEIFFNKKRVKNPNINIVIGQAGAGKSSVTNLIIKEEPNTIILDSDKFKNYSPLKEIILKNFPTYFGHLTGLDSYLVRDYIYKKALKKHYNILIEVTPSTSEELFNINFEELKTFGYAIKTHFIVVCKINGLISVHERYENQIKNNYSIPKLTDFKRAVNSYDAVKIILEKMLNKNIEINLYKRNYPIKTATKIAFNKTTCLTTFLNLEENDYLKTIKR